MLENRSEVEAIVDRDVRWNMSNESVKYKNVSPFIWNNLQPAHQMFRITFLF